MNITDIGLQGGYWMALIPCYEKDEPKWVKVSDLLNKQHFTVKVRKTEDVGKTAMYLT